MNERLIFIVNTAFGLVIMGCAIGLVIGDQACKFDRQVKRIPVVVSNSEAKSDYNWLAGCDYIHFVGDAAMPRWNEYDNDRSRECYEA